MKSFLITLAVIIFSAIAIIGVLAIIGRYLPEQEKKKESKKDYFQFADDDEFNI